MGMLNAALEALDVDAASLWKLETWLEKQWLCWGVALYISLNVGFWVPTLFLEWAIRQKWCEGSLITYGRDTAGRMERMQGSWKKELRGARFDWWSQLRSSGGAMLGPTALFGTFVGSFVLGAAMPKPSTPLPAAGGFLTGLVAMELVGDFLLYWGHRVQHTNKWLWDNLHSFHHMIDTPSAVSTVCINEIDATLQASLPILFAMVICQAHPVTCWVYAGLRLAENVVNHSGIEAVWLDVLTLKILPGRAAVRHHDSHHRFSNYAGFAKNYGENFWLWDYAFGTYADTAPRGAG